jgi:hypothetical protein
VTEATYEAGEIVIQCGCTVDVYVKESKDVTIGDNSLLAWEGRLISMHITNNDLVCMRVALVAGDRLRIHRNASSLPRYRSGAFGAMVTSDHGPWVRFEDMAASSSPVQECRWDESMTGVWETSCERMFEVTTGTPAENQMRFCYHCGKTLVVVVKTGEQQ